MKLSRTSIKWIYVRDDATLNCIDSQDISIFNEYQQCLQEIFSLLEGNEEAEELILKLDALDGHRQGIIETNAYIKGFEMCMKMMQGE